MPIMKCQRDGKSGYKWGAGGGCVVGPNAKKTVIRQAIKIEGPEKFKEIMKSEGYELCTAEEIDEVIEELVIAGEIDRYDYYSEAYVSQQERKSIPDSEFGLPSEKKYPADTLAHFKAACKLYGRAPKDKQAEIKRNLIRIGRKKGFPIPTAWLKDDDKK